MHHHNDWYAHVRILAEYAGVPTGPQRPRVWGYLQHGWNVYNGFGARTPLVAGMPKLVWSEAPGRPGWALGEPNFQVIAEVRATETGPVTACLYGDEMLIEDEHPAYGGNARIRRQWPELHNPAIHVDIASGTAVTELGLAHVAPLEEIAEICGWSNADDRSYAVVA